MQPAVTSTESVPAASAPASGAGGLSSWLSSPLTLAASTLQRAIGGSPHRPPRPPPAVATTHAPVTAASPSHRPHMEHTASASTTESPSRRNSRANGTVANSHPAGASATSALASDAAAAAGDGSGFVYPVHTSQQLYTYTAALVQAATVTPQVPRPPPAPAAQYMGGASKGGSDVDDAVSSASHLPTDEYEGTSQRQHHLHSQAHSHPHARPTSRVAPLYGVVCGMSRRGSFDSIEDEAAAAESLRYRLQRQLQLQPPPQSPPRSQVQSPDVLPTGSPHEPKSQPWSKPSIDDAVSPPAAVPSALPPASSAALSDAPTRVEPTHPLNGSNGLAGLASQPSADALPLESLNATALSQSLSPPQNHSARESSSSHVRALSAPPAAVVPPVVPVSPVTRNPASIPDLSSFSSANFDEHEDEDTDTDRDDSVVGVSTLLPDLGLRLPFGFGAPRAPPPAPAEPDHFSSTTVRDGDFAPATAADADPPRNVKLLNFQRLLADEHANLNQLRQMSWNGIPASCRAMSWKLLLGYVPVAESRRSAALQKRRAEYEGHLREFYFCGPPESYDESSVHRTETELEILKQIRQDVPRTSPTIPFFKDPPVQRSLERILYIFALRHPASGYVQGMNDLATPFYTVFALELYDLDIMAQDESPLAESEYLALEADVCWCMGYLIAGIQDNYTFAQPGIQRMVYNLASLILRIDGDSHTTTNATGTGPAVKANGAARPHIGLHEHLERENVQFLHFSFRWMCTLLLRELRLPLILRLWDSYLSETDGFKVLHVYVCAAFLMRWKDELKRMDFQQLIQFLQKLPTDSWVEQDVETLLAQAHVYQTLFHKSHHLQ